MQLPAQALQLYYNPFNLLIMPIEIKELHIKAVVSGKEKENNRAAMVDPEEINKLKKEITKEVTDKILRILRQKNER